jgi:2-dehydro-3-deoxyphosphogluconate aldolase/(4S)-4-hydroxy-2-oxoglutarate aldolase
MNRATRDDTLRLVRDTGVVAIVRMSDSGKVRAVVDALLAGGVKALEITLTVPRAVELIAEVSADLSDDFVLGAGTVLDPETARQVILAGARFVVAPTLNLDVIRMCHRYDVAAMPGCFTPTEILTAWEAGADLVKLFPAGAVGPAYLKDVRAPLPQVPLMPTGGVSLANAGDWIRAGAAALGMGSALLDPKAIAEGRLEEITSRARQLMASVRTARTPAA